MEQNFKSMVYDLAKQYGKIDELADALNVGSTTVKGWLTSDSPKPTGPHFQAVNDLWQKHYPTANGPNEGRSGPKRGPKAWLATGKFRNSVLVVFEDIVENEDRKTWASGSAQGMASGAIFIGNDHLKTLQALGVQIGDRFYGEVRRSPEGRSKPFELIRLDIMED